MKRVAATIATAGVLVFLVAGVALAGDISPSASYPPSPSSTSTVAGNSGGTAFTGSNSHGVILVIAVLVIVGLAALLVARRRAAHS